MRPVPLILLILLLLAGGLGWFALSLGSGADEAPSAALVPKERPQRPTPVDEAPEPTSLPDARVTRDAEEARPRPDTLNDVRRQPSDVRALEVRGLVLDGRSSPVAGVRVLLGPTAGSPGIALDAAEYPRELAGEIERATTNGNGVFTLEVEGAEHPWSLAVRSPGYASIDRHGLKLPTSGSHRVVDVILDQGVEISGTVVDEGRVGVPNAELFTTRDTGTGAPEGTRFRAGSSVARADVRGAFHVDCLPAGEVRLLVRGPGHPDRVWVGPLAGPGEHLVGVEIVLEDAATIAGHVLELSGEPVPDLVVVAFGERGGDASPLGSARTAEDGSFELSGLPSRPRYFLRAHRESDPRAAVTERWVTDVVGAAAGTLEARLYIAPPSAVVFRAVDAESGEALEVTSVTARVEIGRGTVRQHEAVLEPGVEWRNLPDGGVRIDRFPWSGEDCRARLEVAVLGRDAVTTDAFRLRRGNAVDLGELPFSGSERLRVQVVDAKTGAPIRGAQVHLEPAADPASGRAVATEPEPWGMAPVGSRVARTGDDGLATIAGERGRAYELWADHADYAPSTPVPLTVASPPPAEPIRIGLSVGGTVVVIATDSRGSPVADLSLVHAELGPDGEVTDRITGGHRTDADGRMRFEGLRDGLHGFGVETDSELVRRGLAERNPELQPDGFVHVRAVAGVESEVHLVVPLPIDLAGRVTEEGVPLPGAVVRLYTDRQEALDADAGFSAPSETSATTDGRGEFRIQGIVAGSYAVTVEHPTHAMRQHWVLSLTEADSRCELDLEVLVVEGVLRTPDGAPVAGARVRVERPREDADELPAWLLSDLAEASQGSGSVATGTASAADGSYSIRGLDASGPLVVVARSPWTVPARSEVFGFPEGTKRVRVDLVLEPAGGVRARLESLSGRLAGYQLAAHPLDREGERITSPPADEDGTIRLAGLVPGRYRFELISFFGSGALPDPVEGLVEAGADLELLFQVE